MNLPRGSGGTRGKDTRGGRRKGYVIRGGGGTNGSYHLTVPPYLARLVGPDARFLPELTEDGILYRRFEPAPVEQAIPAWVRRGR